jgi:hypothetical protein
VPGRGFGVKFPATNLKAILAIFVKGRGEVLMSDLNSQLRTGPVRRWNRFPDLNGVATDFSRAIVR